MLATLAPSTANANFTLATEQKSCAIPDILSSINVHNTTGPVTFNIYCTPSQPSPLNTRLDGQIIAIVVITTLIAHQLLRTLSRWSSDHISTFTHVLRDIPAGRSGAVSDPVHARKASLTGVLQFVRDWDGGNADEATAVELQALSFDQELASKGALPPREQSYPVEPKRE